MFLWLRLSLFLIVCIATIIECNSEIKLNLNFNEDFKYRQYDPFVISVSKKQVYKILPGKTSDGEAIFRSYPSDRLVLACPARTEQEITESEKEDVEFLFEDELGTNLFCKSPLKPYVQKMKKEDGDNCGKDGEGLTYLVGYPILKFVDLYEMCYCEEKGIVIFTMHSLHSNSGLNKNKISQDQLQKLKLHRIRKDINVNELNNNKKPDERVHQLVPYDDMELIPWKNATLLDINTILVNDAVKKQLDTINYILQNLSNEIGSFKVYTGVTDISADSKWYWKVIKRTTKHQEHEALGILLFYSQSHHSKPQSPCENNEETCKRSGLAGLKKDIPNLFCCLVDKTLAIKIGLVAKIDNEIFYPTAELPVKFPPKVVPQHTKDSHRGTYGGFGFHGGHGSSHGSEGNNDGFDAGMAAVAGATIAANYNSLTTNEGDGGTGVGAGGDGGAGGS